MPSRTKCGFCEPVQQVAWPSLISTTAQAGPMQACDWNGHSYSASITRAAVLNASSTLPTGLHVLALAHRRLADVVVERGLLGKRRRRVRPLDLDRLGRLDGVPLLVGDHGEEIVLAHHPRAGDVLDRGLVDPDRGRAGDRRADHAGMQHAGHLHVGDERLLAEHLGGDVGALDRLADDLVVLRVLWLGLAGGVERCCRSACSSRAATLK